MASPVAEHIYPVHPRPQPGESLESWLIRYAFSNFSSLIHFVRLLGTNTTNIDLDANGKNQTLFTWVKTELGESTSSDLLLSRFEGVLGPTLGKWTTTGPVHQFRRFCPACFAGDDSPFLRLIWRLNFLLTCPVHQVFLESKCGACSAEFRPTMSNPYFDIGKCSQCGFSLSRTHLRNVSQQSKLLWASEGLSALVQSGAANLGQTRRPDEIFDALLVTVRLALNPKAEQKRPSDIGGSLKFSHGSETYGYALGRAWELLNDEKELDSLTRRYQAYFNRVVQNRCPTLLLRYHRAARPRPKASEIDWKKVRTLAEKMSSDGRRIGIQTIEREMGFGRGFFANKTPPRLRTYIRKIRSTSAARRTALLTALIMALPVSQLVTVRNLSKSSGLKQSVLGGMLYGKSRTSRLKQTVDQAVDRTSHYYSSFPCKTLTCPKRGEVLSGSVRLFMDGVAFAGGPQESRRVYCSTCKKVQVVDVSGAPLQKDYLPS